MKFLVISPLVFIAIGNAAGFANMPECGEPKVPGGGKIVGGRDAIQGEVPWIVHIGHHVGHHGRVFWYCGGSIITKRHVLTAGHCDVLETPKKTPSFVHLGDIDSRLSENSEVINVVKAIRHEHFENIFNSEKNSSYAIYDIAMLHLEKDIVFTDFILPICLPEVSDFNIDNLLGQTATIAGWGLISFTNLYTPDILKIANVIIFDNEVCEEPYQNGGISITDNQICAGTEAGGVDACTLDSGGPLSVMQGMKHFLTGIVSFGAGCALKGYPAIYTRVSSHLDWIHQQLTE